jgi:thiamine-monophosphate kinase
MNLEEMDIIAHIRDTFPGGAALTDDCGAVPLPGPGKRLLVTTDIMEDGRHFRRTWHPPELLGRKLLTVNLSDLDASGAAPLGFTLSLAVGVDLQPRWLEAFLDGLGAAAREAGVPVLGGDTVGRERGLGLGITAFGEAGRWLRRDAMEPGDFVYVDQEPGASLRGLAKLQQGIRWEPGAPDPDLAAHLDPRPNLGLGLRLARIPEVHACLDLSDGLSRDLRNLARASDLSVILEPDLPGDWVQGGEDYARCFSSSLPLSRMEELLGVRLFQVGRAVERGEGPLLHYDGGSLRPCPDRSFDHFAPTPERP